MIHTLISRRNLISLAIFKAIFLKNWCWLIFLGHSVYTLIPFTHAFQAAVLCGSTNIFVGGRLRSSFGRSRKVYCGRREPRLKPSSCERGITPSHAQRYKVHPRLASSSLAVCQTPDDTRHGLVSLRVDMSQTNLCLRCSSI